MRELGKSYVKIGTVLKYNPDQPRDSHGRFGSGDGGESDNKTLRSYKGHDYRPDEPMFKHLVSDGKGGFKLDAERQALHDQIKAHFLSGVPVSANPTLHMLGGGPAAGKSTAVNNPEMGIPQTERTGADGKPELVKTDAVLVNADVIKDLIPEYLPGVEAKDPEIANAVHEESSMLSKEVFAEALQNGQNVVFDGTGDSSIGKLTNNVQAAQSLGYNVVGTYVTCPTDEAVGRMMIRGGIDGGPKGNGRYIPEDQLRMSHIGVSTVFPQAIASNLFDSVRVIDSGRGGEVIAQGTKQGGLQILDQQAYNEFLAKASESNAPKGPDWMNLKAQEIITRNQK